MRLLLYFTFFMKENICECEVDILENPFGVKIETTPKRKGKKKEIIKKITGDFPYYVWESPI